MPAKGNIALESLGNFGPYRANRIQRERSGEAEVHQRANDLFVVESGEATLVTGGRLANPKTTARGELRGPAIEGGQQQKVAPGDIVHVPAGVPHQLLLAPGGHMTYFALKIDARP
jgi:mannose-6-phosphate isomerase-like protein (cupin superfamily)